MSWQKLCLFEELSLGEGKEFLVEGRVIAVFRTAEDLRAVDGMCAHQGGPIAQGQLDHHCVTCPWHGWQYDIMTGNNVLTGKKMLDTFELEVRDNEVWIQLA